MGRNVPFIKVPSKEFYAPLVKAEGLRICGVKEKQREFLRSGRRCALNSAALMSIEYHLYFSEEFIPKKESAAAAAARYLFSSLRSHRGPFVMQRKNGEFVLLPTEDRDSESFAISKVWRAAVACGRDR